MIRLTENVPLRRSVLHRLRSGGFGWLRFAPTWIIAIDGDRKPSCYRLRYDWWSGNRRLIPTEFPGPTGSMQRGVSAIAILDASIPFRRKLQHLPESQRAREALLRAAVDKFPLPSEDLDFGLGIREGDAYLYALPRSVRRELEPEGFRIEALLVADGPAQSTTACSNALDNFERLGSTLSLGVTPRLLPRRYLLNWSLGATLFAGLIVAALLALQPPLVRGMVDRHVEELREQVGELPRIFAATESMAHAHDAAAKLAADPAAKLPGELAQLFATIPPGLGIRRAEYKAGVLHIAGSGADAKQWLINAGFPANSISIEQSAGISAWQAEKPIR